jgi:hypothetical protein
MVKTGNFIVKKEKKLDTHSGDGTRGHGRPVAVQRQPKDGEAH